MDLIFVKKHLLQQPHQVPQQQHQQRPPQQQRQQVQDGVEIVWDKNRRPPVWPDPPVPRGAAEKFRQEPLQQELDVEPGRRAERQQKFQEPEQLFNEEVVADEVNNKDRKPNKAANKFIIYDADS